MSHQMYITDNIHFNKQIFGGSKKYVCSLHGNNTPLLLQMLECLNKLWAGQHYIQGSLAGQLS